MTSEQTTPLSSLLLIASPRFFPLRDSGQYLYLGNLETSNNVIQVVAINSDTVDGIEKALEDDQNAALEEGLNGLNNSYYYQDRLEFNLNLQEMLKTAAYIKNPDPALLDAVALTIKKNYHFEQQVSARNSLYLSGISHYAE